jgi:hypothetical protein
MTDEYEALPVNCFIFIQLGKEADKLVCESLSSDRKVGILITDTSFCRPSQVKVGEATLVPTHCPGRRSR